MWPVFRATCGWADLPFLLWTLQSTQGPSGSSHSQDAPCGRHDGDEPLLILDISMFRVRETSRTAADISGTFLVTFCFPPPIMVHTVYSV